MVNYAFGFNQSETGKYFEWTIMFIIERMEDILSLGDFIQPSIKWWRIQRQYCWYTVVTFCCPHKLSWSGRENDLVCWRRLPSCCNTVIPRSGICIVWSPVQSTNLQRWFGYVAGNDRLVRLYDGTQEKTPVRIDLFTDSAVILNLLDLRSIMVCPGGTRSVFTRVFRAKRDLHCIFLGKKAIIIASKHGTTIFLFPLQSKKIR